MALFDPEIVDRLDRVLEFLALTGGAALVRRNPRAVVATHGRIDSAVAISSLDMELDAVDAVVHVPPDGLVAEVSWNYRVFVRLSTCPVPKPEIVTRMRRARVLLERFVISHVAHAGPVAPPSAAPAHAAVYARRT